MTVRLFFLIPMQEQQEQLSEIMSLLQAGRFAEAERRLRAFSAAEPLPSEALLLLAVSVHYQQRAPEALEMYLELTRRHPDSGVYWGNYATALHESGKLEDAERAFRVALKHEPVEPGTLHGFGLLLLQKEQYVEAREVLLRAYESDPDSAEIALAATKACNACGDFRTERMLDRWRQWLPLDNARQLELSGLLLAAGQAESARELAEELVHRDPGNIAVLLQLVKIYERVNRIGDAEAALSRIAQHLDSLGEPLQNEMTHLRAELAFRKKDFASAKGLLLAGVPRNERDFEHYFVLARTYDKLGEADAAMSALNTAHARQVDKIKAVAPQIFADGAPVLAQAEALVSADEFKIWPELTAPEARQSPVFVVGFPRSGTTLLEQMLDAHPGLQSMDERPFFNILAHQLEEYGATIPRDLGNLDQRDCDELRKGYLLMACGKVPRQWDAQLVDKNPLNMLWMPMIHRLFPRAKWILALRHPCDVVLSCYMQSFRANVLAAACANLERLAHAYVSAMESWLHHVGVFHPDALASRYEDLVVDAPASLQKIAKFIGVEDASPMMRFDQRAKEKGFIATPSYTQVIEPVNAAAMGRWLRYREHFEPILPILQPMIERWGYSIDPR